jgi:hypothetical protein
MPTGRQVTGLLHKARRYLFGYDAVESKNRRQAPTGRLRSEDKELLPHQRRKLTSASRDIHRNFTIAAWAIRRAVATRQTSYAQGFSHVVSRLPQWRHSRRRRIRPKTKDLSTSRGRPGIVAPDLTWVETWCINLAGEDGQTRPVPRRFQRGPGTTTLERPRWREASGAVSRTAKAEIRRLGLAAPMAGLDREQDARAHKT